MKNHDPLSCYKGIDLFIFFFFQFFLVAFIWVVFMVGRDLYRILFP